MIYKGIINTINVNDKCRIVIWGGVCMENLHLII